MESYYRLHKNYRSSKYPWIYRFLVTDSDLRALLGIGSNCGPVTFITCMLAVTVLACVVAGTRILAMNKELCENLQKDSEAKMPRKKSILRIKPVYECVYNHLRHTDLFLENTKKTLIMEHLQLERIYREISTIHRLLEPNNQTQWRRSRSRKEFIRAISPEATPRDELVKDQSF